jgi:hypothetical protein
MPLNYVQSVLSEVYSADKVSNGRIIDSAAIAALIRKACTRRVCLFTLQEVHSLTAPSRSSTLPYSLIGHLARILQGRNSKKRTCLLDFYLPFYLKQKSMASSKRLSPNRCPRVKKTHANLSDRFSRHFIPG